MIISNPVIRFALKVMSVCGLAHAQNDSVAVRGSRPGHATSPFVLVTPGADGKWGVFQHDYDRPLATFERKQEACDYANEHASTQTDAMVLLGKRRDTSAHPDSSRAERTA